MNDQKVNYTPTYKGVPITEFRTEEGTIMLDVIDMPEANKAWSLHIGSSGEGSIAIYAGNSLDVDFALYKVKDSEGIFVDTIDFNSDPKIYSELDFNYRYMRIELEIPSAENPVSISMVK